MPTLEPILEKLARSQRALMRTADSIPAEQWKLSPGEGAWSDAELTAHLVIVERSILATTDRVLQKPRRRVPLLKRFHLPMALVEARVVRRKTPIPLDVQLLREKEGMLAELRGVRERTLAFLEETKGRDLSTYRWRHPFLGSFNVYEWFTFVAAHQIRHEKQLREIATVLPKAIATLQK